MKYLAALLFALPAHAGSLDSPRLDPKPIAPACTTFFGLPCHEGFQYDEPGNPGIPTSVRIRDFTDEIDDWFDGPEQEPEVCE